MYFVKRPRRKKKGGTITSTHKLKQTRRRYHPYLSAWSMEHGAWNRNQKHEHEGRREESTRDSYSTCLVQWTTTLRELQPTRRKRDKPFNQHHELPRPFPNSRNQKAKDAKARKRVSLFPSTSCTQSAPADRENGSWKPQLSSWTKHHRENGRVLSDVVEAPWRISVGHLPMWSLPAAWTAAPQDMRCGQGPGPRGGAVVSPWKTARRKAWLRLVSMSLFAKRSLLPASVKVRRRRWGGGRRGGGSRKEAWGEFGHGRFSLGKLGCLFCLNISSPLIHKNTKIKTMTASIGRDISTKYLSSPIILIPDVEIKAGQPSNPSFAQTHQNPDFPRAITDETTTTQTSSKSHPLNHSRAREFAAMSCNFCSSMSCQDPGYRGQKGNDSQEQFLLLSCWHGKAPPSS
ncbi:hypothetical protein B0T10DRAFT_454193 [Thelonectria olida]|uniref:Uncharacterized protein n=1 Tax=Thelonectria olida TaxID=1576542 RepID=A0A9P8WGW3_9HYPO|nr:hypothetical protein B0T10DRAFT_454193 [Thelonectria olida]